MFAEIKSTSSRLSRGRFASVLVGSALLFAACGDTADVEEPTVAALPEATESATDSAPQGEDGADENSDSESNEDSAPDLSPEEAQLAFSQCLEDEGVEDPFGGIADGEVIGGDDGESQAGIVTFSSDEEFEAFEAAQEKCGEILGAAFGEFEASPEQEAAMKDAELKFSQCMSEQGFEMSDGGIQIEEGDFEKIDEATKQCDEVFEELNSQLADNSEDN